MVFVVALAVEVVDEVFFQTALDAVKVLKNVIQQNLFIENISIHYSSIHFPYKSLYINQLFNEQSIHLLKLLFIIIRSDGTLRAFNSHYTTEDKIVTLQ